MRHAGRAASAAEKQRVLDDVAAVEADSSQADATLQVRCSRQLPCPVSVLYLCAASPACLCGRRQGCAELHDYLAAALPSTTKCKALPI